MLDPGPDQDEEPEPECITAPVPLRQKVEVPAVPQHRFSPFNYITCIRRVQYRFVANCCKERVFFSPLTENV
jgi:hypothetical protein